MSLTGRRNIAGRRQHLAAGHVATARSDRVGLGVVEALVLLLPWLTVTVAPSRRVSPRAPSRGSNCGNGNPAVRGAGL